MINLSGMEKSSHLVGFITRRSQVQILLPPPYSKVIMKVCSKCKEEKPDKNFYFKKQKNRLYSSCKICHQTSDKNSKFSSHWYTSRFDEETLKLFSTLKNLCTKAKLRNKEFDPEVTWETLFELWEKQNGECTYSGLPLSTEANHPHKVSLDRIDSDNGYVADNLQLVSASVNRMKQEFDEEFFVDMCVLIANNKATQ